MYIHNFFNKIDNINLTYIYWLGQATIILYYLSNTNTMEEYQVTIIAIEIHRKC